MQILRITDDGYRRSYLWHSGDFITLGRKTHELQSWDIRPSLALAALVVPFAYDIPFR